MRGVRAFNIAALAFGFAFLYVPIALLIIYSFNESRLVTVWGGFSTRWYASLWSNQQMMSALRNSLIVAISSASIATVLGTLAAYSLARFGRFRTRGLFTTMIYTPLVLPEVILGLSLLLLFVSLGVERGLATIIIAHSTMGLCFVTVIVYPRLAAMDLSLEEAAMDLGATPFRTFWSVTLPMAAPAIMSGFLLAMTISLDDLVIASFTSGPGSSTLPMRIYSQVRLGVTPEVNAISTLMLLTVGVLLLTGLAFSQRGAKRNVR
jgi:putrescine transport system permease protein